MPYEDITHNLPYDARVAGLELVWRGSQRRYSVTVTLLNRENHALFLWPYTPSIAEVREKSMELLKEGRIYD